MGKPSQFGGQKETSSSAVAEKDGCQPMRVTAGVHKIYTFTGRFYHGSCVKLGTWALYIN